MPPSYLSFLYVYKVLYVFPCTEFFVYSFRYIIRNVLSRRTRIWIRISWLIGTQKWHWVCKLSGFKKIYRKPRCILDGYIGWRGVKDKWRYMDILFSPWHKPNSVIWRFPRMCNVGNCASFASFRWIIFVAKQYSMHILFVKIVIGIDFFSRIFIWKLRTWYFKILILNS